MAKQWNILLCDVGTRLCPVSDFIESCRPAHQIKLIRIMKLLEEMGPNLPRPYADLLRDGIHELRVKLSGEQIRLLYFFCCEYYIVFFEVVHKLFSEGLSRQKLAARTGFPVEDLTALEDGEHCRYDLVIELCHELQVPVPAKCKKVGFFDRMTRVPNSS